MKFLLYTCLSRTPTRFSTQRLAWFAAMALWASGGVWAQPGRPFPGGAGAETNGSAQAGNVPQDLAAGDFNVDGAIDLAVTNAFDDTITLLMGDGAGNFAPGATLSVDRSPGLGDDLPREIIITDLNRDGLGDLAAINSGNPAFAVAPSAVILAGDRKGGFEPARFPELSSSGNPSRSLALASGRFDSDDRPDLIAGNSGSNTISFLENKGALAFESGVDFSVSTSGDGPAALIPVDFDLNGDLDLILVNRAELAVMTGDGEGNFDSQQTLADGGFWQDAAVSDFDHDGAWDAAAVDFDSMQLSVFLDVDLGGGFAQRRDTVLPFAGASSLATADFNQDGFEDVAVAFLDQARVGIFLGLGNGLFSSGGPMFVTGQEPRSLLAADLNGDGVADLASANEGDEVIPSNADVSINIVPFPPETFAKSEAQASDEGAAALGAGIAFPAGAGWHPGRSTLFVAAPESGELVEVSPAGVRVGAIDATALGAFDPSDVAVDPASGDLFFADRLEARVFRVTPAGALVSSFSTASAGATRPAGIAFRAAANQVLVSDEIEAKVHAFSPAGSPLGDFEADKPLLDLAYDDGADRLWGIALGEDEIEAFSLDEVEDDLDEEAQLELDGISPLLNSQPLRAIAFDGAADRFYLIGPRGLLLTTDGAGAPLGAAELGLGLGFAGADGDPANGDFWLLDRGALGSVLRRSPAGDYSLVFAANAFDASDPLRPAGLAAGENEIYIACQENETIGRYAKNGSLLGTTSVPWAEGLKIEGLEFDSATGRLLLLTPGRIFETDVGGAMLDVVSVSLVRDFADLSLDAEGSRIALYSREGGETWFFGRDGALLLRGTTPDFLEPAFRVGAGGFDPQAAEGQRLFGEVSASAQQLTVPLQPPTAVRRWADYR